MATTEVREDGTHIVLATEDTDGYGYDNKTSDLIIDGTATGDTITNYAARVVILSYDGDDVIGTYSSIGSSFVTIDGGSGDDKLHNGSSYDPGSPNVSINGNDGDDWITNNYANDVTIDGGAGKDTIWNGSVQNNSGGSNVIIHAGEGDDNLSNYNSNVTIDGGAGNDYIRNADNSDFLGTNISLNPGLGNDYIDFGRGNSENVIKYTEGDGKDTVYNYSDNDTLQINSSVSWSQSTVNNTDILITVGEGSILLVGAADSAINISGTENTDTINGETTAETNNATQTDTTATDTGTTVHGSIEYGGHTYYYISTSELPAVQGTGESYSAAEKWNAAKAMCASLNGYMAVIDDANENAALFDALTNKFGLGHAYFGLTDEATEGTWIDSNGNVAWVSGDLQWDTDELGNYTGNFSYPNSQTYTYVNWAQNEPSNAATTDGTEIHRENYATFYPEDIAGSGKFANGEWNDGDFSGTVSFICEVDGVATTDTVSYNGHTYRRIDENLTWEEAKVYCESQGGHLVTITEEGEQNAVASLVNQSGLPYFGYWMGGNYIDSVKSWITGENFSYEHFAENQPDGDGNDSHNYLQMFGNLPDSLAGNTTYANFYIPGYWDNTTNDGSNAGELTEHGFICEWEPDDVTITFEASITGSNGNTYYLVSADKAGENSWNAARTYMQNLGGDLAIINDATENAELFNFINGKTGEAYFGLSDAAQEGTWTWVDGSTPTYGNWADGQPDNGYDLEDYAMFYGAYADKWNDGAIGLNGDPAGTKYYFLGEVEGEMSDSSYMYKLSFSQYDFYFTPPENSWQYQQAIAAGRTPIDQ